MAVTVGGYRFELVDKLGKGSFADVYKGQRIVDRLAVAIKQIHKNRIDESSNKKLLEGEIAIMKELQHDNVVALYDTIWEADYICLVMEYCNGQDLAKYIAKHAPLEEPVIAYFAGQVASALSYLHARRIVHRDLKPQNILLHYQRGAKRPILKIADFGFARHLTLNMAETFCGSPLYMAPEILFNRGYNEISDMWGVGAVLYQCLTGKPPFRAKNIQALKALLRSADSRQLQYPRGASKSICEMLSGLLQISPDNRMKCADFYSHPFLGHDEACTAGLECDDDRRRVATVAERAWAEGVPYGDAPATPSPTTQSPVGSFGDGGSVVDVQKEDSMSGTSTSFVIIDKDKVELNVIADDVQHRREQMHTWPGHARWNGEPNVSRSEVDRFVTAIRRRLKPASAIMHAAKPKLDTANARRELWTPAFEATVMVEALKLYNQALSLLRVGMGQVRSYIDRNHDSILYTDSGGEVVQELRSRFNECLTVVESLRRKLPDSISMSQYKGLVVKSTEELLFEYAIDLSRRAAVAEVSGELPQCEVMYSRAVVLFVFLREGATPQQEDVLQEYVVATRKRLELVVAASALSNSRARSDQYGDQLRAQFDFRPSTSQPYESRSRVASRSQSPSAEGTPWQECRRQNMTDWGSPRQDRRRLDTSGKMSPQRERRRQDIPGGESPRQERRCKTTSNERSQRQDCRRPDTVGRKSPRLNPTNRGSPQQERRHRDSGGWESSRQQHRQHDLMGSPRQGRRHHDADDLGSRRQQYRQDGTAGFDSPQQNRQWQNTPNGGSPRQERRQRGQIGRESVGVYHKESDGHQHSSFSTLNTYEQELGAHGMSSSYQHGLSQEPTSINSVGAYGEFQKRRFSDPESPNRDVDMQGQGGYRRDSSGHQHLGFDSLPTSMYTADAPRKNGAKPAIEPHLSGMEVADDSHMYGADHTYPHDADTMPGFQSGSIDRRSIAASHEPHESTASQRSGSFATPTQPMQQLPQEQSVRSEVLDLPPASERSPEQQQIASLQAEVQRLRLQMERSSSS